MDTFKFHVKSKKGRKKVEHRITKLVRQYHVPNTHHEYGRALGNAVAHGKPPVRCKVYMGQQYQMVCVIQDHGSGFNYQDVIHKFHKGEVYYHYKGLGTRSFARNEQLKVDWKDDGREIILFYGGA